MRPRVREIGARIRAESTGLLGWWLEELRASWDSLLGRLAPKSLTRTVIELDASGGRVFSVRGQDRRSVLEFACDTAGAWPDDPERLSSVEAIQGSRAVAALAGGFALVHQIVLPRALEREIDSVIPLQLERELPLSPDRVAVDWRILKRPRAEPRITVEVLIVHRAVIDRVQALARALRVELVRVGLAREGGGLVGDLLHVSARVSPLRLNAREARLALTAAALAVLWGLLIGGQWLYERARVGRALQEVAPRALHVDRLSGQLTQEAAPAEALLTLMREPDALDVLTALTEAVPKDSWAYELDISAQPSQAAEIRASTFTPTATLLVDLLNRAPRFQQVKLISASSDGLFTGDRLTLTARWENPSGIASSEARGEPLPDGRPP
jgi:hypothetical protein